MMTFKGKDKLISIAKKLVSKEVITNASSYEAKVQLYNAILTEEKKNKTIFLGDSLILNGMWAEVLDNPNIINRGIGGDTTNGISKRFDEIITLQPKQLFVMMGINDLGVGKNPKEILTNYEGILSRAIKDIPNVEIFIHSVLPINNDMNKSNIDNSNVIEVNKGLKELSKKLEITFINIHPLFSDVENSLMPEMTWDGIHLSAKGYMTWKSEIEDKVSRGKQLSAV